MTAVHGDSIIALAKWLDSPAGAYVMAWEQAQLDVMVADIFGYNAVQLGMLKLPALRNNRMPFVFAVEEPAALPPPLAPAAGAAVTPFERDATRRAAGSLVSPRRAMVLARFEELPFAAQSLDLLVLPHVLEFAEDPHQVLREVERVLIAEGQLIVTGFNPVSLWGARQGLGRLLDAPFLPQAGQFLHLPRLKDWLKLLGFEVNRGRFGCYRPPLRAQAWLERFAFMEHAGDRWWPVCGAVYMVSAVKRVAGMRLIGAIKKERKTATPQLAPTAQRHHVNRSPAPGAKR